MKQENRFFSSGREEAYLASPRVWSFVPTCVVGAWTFVFINLCGTFNSYSV